MKGTNFRRILCILIAAMLCIGLLPIGAAADSYAAAAELRSMQKVRREILTEIHESRASTARMEQLSATL